MLNENQLFFNLAERHYTFKRAELPQAFDLGAINQSQKALESPLRK
jgi:hypothetical protein